MCSSIENPRDRLVRFLARRIPYLHLDYLVLNAQAIRAELDTDSNLVLRFEFIVHYSLHEARLSNTRIADNDQLKHVVVLLLQGLVGDVLVGLLL